MAIREFTDPLTQLLEKYGGLRVEPLVLDIAAGGSMLIIGLLTIKQSINWIRRNFLGDNAAISDELKAAVELIKGNVEEIKVHVEQMHGNLSAQITSRLSEIVDEVRDKFSDQSVEQEEVVEIPADGRGLRQEIAREVRTAIMKAYFDGRWLSELPKRRHVFKFGRRSRSGIKIEIELMTPYRDSSAPEDALVAELHVWADDVKVLNYKWQGEADRKPLRLKAGGWVGEIVSWNFDHPEARSKDAMPEVQVQAAE